MKNEQDVREMRKIISVFGHPKAVEALDWVLDELVPEPAATKAERDADRKGA